jgi:hypothetical protein
MSGHSRESTPSALILRGGGKIYITIVMILYINYNYMSCCYIVCASLFPLYRVSLLQANLRHSSGLSTNRSRLLYTLQPASTLCLSTQTRSLFVLALSSYFCRICTAASTSAPIWFRFRHC